MPFIKLLKNRRNDTPTVRKREYQKVYQDKRWRLLRAEKMRCNPICEKCEKVNRIRPTDEVHHIVPFDIRPDLAFDWDNLQSLCLDCHDEIHKNL
jgi:5-methylcytosine-specific restriction protein A